MSWNMLGFIVANCLLGVGSYQLGFLQGRTRGRIDVEAKSLKVQVAHLKKMNDETDIMRRVYLEALADLEARGARITTTEETIQ